VVLHLRRSVRAERIRWMQSEYAGVALNWAYRSEVGRVRALNQDAFLAEPPVFAVADGMGGHDAGEVASTLTVSRLETLVRSDPPDISEVSTELHAINGMLQDASVDGSRVQMGTTAVGLCVVKNGGVLSWLVVNIGDSRAYSVAGGEMVQMTRDHSYVQQLVDSGHISQAQARTHPEKNVITQALGLTSAIEPDFWIRPIRAGERFLLCSDGLTGEVADDEIASILCGPGSPEEAVGRLTALALEHGGRDNVTLIVVDVDDVGGQAAETTDTRPGRTPAGSDEAGGPLLEAPDAIMDGIGSGPRAPAVDVTIDEVPGAPADGQLAGDDPPTRQTIPDIAPVIHSVPGEPVGPEEREVGTGANLPDPDMITSLMPDVAEPEKLDGD